MDSQPIGRDVESASESLHCYISVGETLDFTGWQQLTTAVLTSGRSVKYASCHESSDNVGATPT
jgi:hypothetical protein